MNLKEKKDYIDSRMKMNNKNKPQLTLEDLYDIYDKCKLYSLIKIVKGEGEVSLYEEDNEERDSDNKEGNIKISL